jgi:hypothetical protein
MVFDRQNWTKAVVEAHPPVELSTEKEKTPLLSLRPCPIFDILLSHKTTTVTPVLIGVPFGLSTMPLQLTAAIIHPPVMDLSDQEATRDTIESMRLRIAWDRTHATHCVWMNSVGNAVPQHGIGRQVHITLNKASVM